MATPPPGASRRAPGSRPTGEDRRGLGLQHQVDAVQRQLQGTARSQDHHGGERVGGPGLGRAWQAGRHSVFRARGLLNSGALGGAGSSGLRFPPGRSIEAGAEEASAYHPSGAAGGAPGPGRGRVSLSVGAATGEAGGGGWVKSRASRGKSSELPGVLPAGRQSGLWDPAPGLRTFIHHADPAVRALGRPEPASHRFWLSSAPSEAPPRGDGATLPPNIRGCG
ncbi:hypothetical protein QTO34_018649 [Cnephaeus nilssonii]|uniref:Uncharacterized protein n=1 Tax=Cnephaeus nilssonii TaxID=3371016 RepID=A0AA40I017_CNENI|nr:hypothetical protein QTO34_018649 [Eptesicus nilssonii]